jgi:hypothetical protein
MFRPSDHKSKELGKATGSPPNHARIFFSPKSCRKPTRPTSKIRDRITVVPNPWHARSRKREHLDQKIKYFHRKPPHTMAPSRTFRETGERNRTADASPWGWGSRRRRRRPWRTGGGGGGLLLSRDGFVANRRQQPRMVGVYKEKREGGGQRGTAGASRPQESDWMGRPLRFLLRLYCINLIVRY